VGNSGTPA
jgi:hypothetical protein